MNFFSHSEVPSLCLRDRRRTEAFRQAIRQAVRPGDVVLDAGSGSGILALFAAQAGARKVYAVEVEPTLAERIRVNAQRNGLADRVEVLAADVRELELPEPADLLVAEMIETWLLDEHQVPAVNALHRRGLLKTPVRCIPAAYDCRVEFGTVAWDCYGLDMPFPIHDWPDLDAERGWLPLPFEPLTEPLPGPRVDFTRPVPNGFRVEWALWPKRTGLCNALRLSGECRLSPEIRLGETVAFNGKKLLPTEPFRVQTGEPLRVRISGEFGSPTQPGLALEISPVEED